MRGISLNELKKVTYANTESLGQRVFLLMPLWDGEKWHSWVQNGAGELVKMQIVDVVRSNYVAKQAAAPDDLFIPFVDFMWQKACWPETSHLISAICDDFHNLATSIAKTKHFFYMREKVRRDSLAPFVQTEMEYVLVLARAIFDLLQEAIASIWNERVRLNDPNAEALRKQHKLHTSFAKIVLDAGTPRTVEQIQAKYALPPSLAQAYVMHAPFFQSLRSLRDGIVHGGNGIDSVFVTEKGFCVSPNSKPFSSLNIWSKHHFFNENIASILPWLAHIVFGTIEACTGIMNGLAAAIPFPEKIAPEHMVFIRDHASDALLDLLKVQKGEMVWWEEPPSR